MRGWGDLRRPLLIGMLMAVSAAAEPWLRHTIDNSSLGADGARSADVNGDGLPDLVTGWEQGGVSRIYLMQREGVAYPTWQMIEVGAAPSVEDALLVDLDQDGAIDVVSSTEGKNRQLLVHWAPSDAERYAESTAWRTETLWAGDKQWMYAISMDIDGQHGPDLVVGAKGAGAEVGWLESPADSRQLDDWKFHRLTDVTWTMSLFARDMDGDGIRDVVVSDRKGEREGVFWLRNPGADSAHLNEPWRKIWIADDLGETTLIDVADREGDGRLEIVVPHMANETDGALTLLKQSPHGDWHRESIAVGGNKTHPKSATVADVNQDGRADIVLSFEKRNDPAASGVIWLEQTSTGWVAHDISGSEGIKFDLNLVIDIDGDGDLDVVNTEENNNAQGGQAGLGLVWYENPLANVPRL